MSGLPAAVRRALFLRSFAVQGSWNYQTLIGTGFAYMLLPALRYQFEGDPRGLRSALRRQAELFNSHPYLVTVAAGAVARLEAEHTNPELVKRFKDALRSPLGSLGDRLFWFAWRPACALGGIALLLLGLPWWIAIGSFLVAYNALHLYIRRWGLEAGFSTGLQVGTVLRDAALERWGDRAASAGALLAGFATVLALSRGERPVPDLLVILAAASGGLLLRGWTRRFVWSVLVVGWFAGVAGVFAPFG